MKCSRTQEAQTEDVKLLCRRLVIVLALWNVVLLAGCQPIQEPSRASDLQVSQSLEEGNEEADVIRLLQLPLDPFPSVQDLIQIVREECRTREAVPPKTEVIPSTSLATDRCRLTDEEESTPLRPAGSVEIPVFVHIIMSGDGTMGDVATPDIEKQIEVLNEAFAGVHPRGVPTPFRFVLVETTRIRNEQWFNMIYSEHEPTEAEVAAKAERNRGDKSTLNLYTANITEPHGWARFPWELDKNVDGVVIGFRYLPNGSGSDYNEGDVATHEVGHWLGLFHTYEGGCAPPGDCVDDTDAEAQATLYCPNAVPDSCPEGFSDEINNYMNYTWDLCMVRFSAGQARRMDAIHRKFRT